jgi:hypothetical protein
MSYCVKKHIRLLVGNDLSDKHSCANRQLLLSCINFVISKNFDIKKGEIMRVKNLIKIFFYTSIFALSNISVAQGCAMNSLGQVICAPAGGGAAVNSLGQVVTGAGACSQNSLGQVVCATTPGGGAITNSLGQVQTGLGQCVRNSIGQTMCSALPGGGAAINSLGQAVCAGGCVAGR